jgi:hypothetical protein
MVDKNQVTIFDSGPSLDPTRLRNGISAHKMDGLHSLTPVSCTKSIIISMIVLLALNTWNKERTVPLIIVITTSISPLQHHKYGSWICGLRASFELARTNNS